MSVWAKDHPVWRIVERALVAFTIIGIVGLVCAYGGADNLDIKDVLSHVINGTAVYHVARKVQ